MFVAFIQRQWWLILPMLERELKRVEIQAVILITLMAGSLVGCHSEQIADDQRSSMTKEQSSASIPDPINMAVSRFREGKFEDALQLVHEVLRDKPEHPQALGLAMEIHSARDELPQAADYGARLALTRSVEPADLLIRCFDWNLRSGRYDVAEKNLCTALELDPRHVPTRRLLVQLYNAQGRRIETREHVEELIRLKAVNWNETLSLIDIGGPFMQITFDHAIDNSDVSLFQLGKMRMDYAGLTCNRDEVIATVKQIASACSGSIAASAFYGRLLIENERYELLPEWFASLPAGIESQPEYWTTLGVWLQHHKRSPEAIRAYGESLRLDCGNRKALRQLIGLLDSTGEEQQAVRLRKQLATLDRIFRIARGADAEQSMWIAAEMQKLARPWESLAWMMHSAQLSGSLPQMIPELDRRAALVSQWEDSTTPEHIADARLKVLLGFDIDDWPLPKLDAIMPDVTQLATAETGEMSGSPQAPSTLRFDDVASELGIVTDTATGFDKRSFYAYQVDCSGLGILDYDLNGLPDLYVMQSGGPPNDPSGSTANQLFRQLPDGLFAETTVPSNTGDRNYGAGVAVGDLNQDGFPDLLLGNVGASVLLLNQGDGSFRDASELIQQNDTVWTSSFAIADLSGDLIPEIIQVNYINDESAFKVKCEGGYLECQPQQFRAAADRILKGNADGTFESWDAITTIADDPKLGLGVVVANFDKQNGNDVFIANDGDVNHFWASTSAASDQASPFTLIESAGLRGCSIGQGGGSQACMGIATGDFNRDGMLDLHVTNFHNEPVNLFMQNKLGYFSDQAIRFGLREPSMSVLGFGTQAGDYDNDGWLDLAVLNGHVYDATDQGIPFRMRPQLLRGNRSGFALAQPEATGTYWQREQLGRTLAVWDFNRDGRMDLVANHLDQPVAVLQNKSETTNWIQLELIGSTSERDAIGAEVKLTAGSESWTAQRTAGDGYMTSNEAVLHFGIGNLAALPRIEVQWPSGSNQSFENVPANTRYLLVEGDRELYPRTP
jgi:tetratricopeptide (TPR) repeat protein